MGLYMRKSTARNYGNEEKECALDKQGSASVYYYAVACTVVGRECVVVYAQAVPSSLQDIAAWELLNEGCGLEWLWGFHCLSLSQHPASELPSAVFWWLIWFC